MRRKRRGIAFIGMALVALLIGLPLWIVGRAFLREKATHDLVVAVYKNDTQAALTALRAGADANTRQLSTDIPPTLFQFVRQFWRRMRGEEPEAETGPDHQPPMIVLAAAKENTTLVKALLGAHAKPDAHTEYGEDEGSQRDDDDETYGRTALMWAAENDRLGMVEALLVKGADPDFSDTHFGDPPLVLTRNTAILKALLEHGADVHAQKEFSKYSGTSVVAQNWDEPENLKLLLAHGADINDGGEYKRPLSLAIQYGKPADVRFLLALGADPNLRETWGDGWDALAYAIDDAMIANMRVLLAHGVDPYKRDKAGRTPLFQAVEHGEDGPVQTLIEAGAKVNVRDNKGKTPLQLSEDDGNDSVEAILRKAGAKR